MTSQIRRAINELENKISGIDLYVIVDVDETNQKYRIKQLNYDKIYEDVEIIGTALGNGKGHIALLNKDDVVLAGLLIGSQRPFILGSVFNIYMDEKDTKIPIKQNEQIIVNQTNGAYVYLKQDNGITLKNNNGTIKLKSNGEIELKNSNGTFTLESTGAVTINNAFTLPTSDGSNGQVLKTDGSGNVTWQVDDIGLE